MIRIIFAALTPTPEQLMNAWLVTAVILGIVAVLVATWWISDHGVDLIVAWWHRRTAVVVDFEERRRATLRRALGGR